MTPILSFRTEKKGTIEKLPYPYGQRVSPMFDSSGMEVDFLPNFGFVELDGGNPPNTLYFFILDDLNITEPNIGDKVSFDISSIKKHNDIDGFDYISATNIKLLNEDELPLRLAYIPSNVILQGVKDNRRYRLHYFTAIAKYNRVKQLLTYGNNINEEDSTGITPLHVASMHRDVQMVELLIENGANINSLDNKGRSPLHFAVQNGNGQAVKILINNGAQVNIMSHDGFQPIHACYSWCGPDSIKYLVEAGADVNSRTSSGMTPLMLNSMAFNWVILKNLKVLLHYGADINATINGLSVLHLYVMENTVEIGTIKLLIKAGADVTALDNDNKTPLYYAKKNNAEGMIKILEMAEKNR